MASMSIIYKYNNKKPYLYIVLSLLLNNYLIRASIIKSILTIRVRAYIKIVYRIFLF